MRRPAPVYVGVDGSSSSVGAADSAGCEALHRDAEVVLLHVGPADDRAFDRAFAQLRQRHPMVTVSGRHLPRGRGDIAETLAEGAADGGLLFVGHRTQPSRRNPALGSVAQRLVDLATVPTIVYRPTDTAWAVPEPRRILAGVAPHASPDAVLEFALAEADRRRTYLDVVCALPATDRDFAEDDIRRWLDKYPEVAGRLHIRHGVDAGIALAVESRTAQLVVVGTASAGHNASVAHALIHRAACPLAVIPGSGLSSRSGRDVRP